MTGILLKTTIPYAEDDWHIGRFAMLTRHLKDEGHDVTAKDRVEDAHAMTSISSGSPQASGISSGCSRSM